MAKTTEVKVRIDKKVLAESISEVIFAYSEWLDSQGLIVGDEVELERAGGEKGPDTRTHEELVHDFLAQASF